MRVFALLLIPAAALAQIEQPHLGWMLDDNSMLRSVYGLAASATVGERLTDGVVGFACIETKCVAKMEHAVALSDRGFAAGSVEFATAPEGAALVGLDADGAFFYFAQTGQTARWSATPGPRSFEKSPAVARNSRARSRDVGRNPVLELFDFSPAGEILAIRSAGSATDPGFDYAVRRESDVWIEHFSMGDRSVTSLGAIEAEVDSDAEGEKTRPIRAVLLLEDGYIASTDGGIAIVRSNGARRDFAIPGVTALFSMSADYAEATTSNGNWVLCVRAGDESANLLPGVSQ